MKLRAWREAKGWSRAKLAERMSEDLGFRVHCSTIQGWESGAIPQKRWRIHIKAFTLGEVTAEDFV